MENNNERILDKEITPDENYVAKWIGAASYKRWKKIARFIDENYNGIFPEDDWIYGGKKHGWCLRFKKSKAFCSLIPERGRFLFLIVLGKEEREKTESALKEFSPRVQKIYNNAFTYHDGKWITLEVDNDEILEEIKKLMMIKRKPKGK